VIERRAQKEEMAPVKVHPVVSSVIGSVKDPHMRTGFRCINPLR
jgi:hypothetical protein